MFYSLVYCFIGVALYCEVRREELLHTANIVNDDVVLEAVLSDLIQRQEVEFETLLEGFVLKKVVVMIIHNK